jgi:hypothetical protein
MLLVVLILLSTPLSYDVVNGRYFLITPKLLPNLKYHRNMKILSINNGKFAPKTLDVDGCIQRAQALQDS